MVAGASNRGDLGTAPIYIIGGVIFFVGMISIFAIQSVDIGLMTSGIGLALIGVQEKPKLNFTCVKYTGPPGLVLFVVGLLLLTHML